MFRNALILLFIYKTLQPIQSLTLSYAITNDVEREQFVYWNVTYRGHVVIHVQSLIGDADLYVRENNTKPGVEPENYDAQSSTCGSDIIQIPEHFIRPVIVGVYGHPSYDASTYLLTVIVIDQDEGMFYERLFTDDRSLDGHIPGIYLVDDKRPTGNQSRNDENGSRKWKKYRLREIVLNAFWSAMEKFKNLFTDFSGHLDDPVFTFVTNILA